MRIAFLQPTYWPEVRRGSERLVHDLGATLAGRGHEITLITSHPGPTRTSTEDGIRVVRSRRPRQLRRSRWYEHHVGNIPNVALRLLRGGYELAHAFFAVDAWTAVRMRRFGGPPVVFSFHGIPAREHLVARRYRLEMLQEASARAEATTVLSEAAARAFRRYLAIAPRVLPGGVVVSDFERDVPRAAAPTLLCAASLGDPRKRGDLLFAAFAELRRRLPDARLQVVRSRDPVLSYVPLRLPEGAEWIEADRTEALAEAYSRAWASVLPAVDEAFGLVIVESLAAGTPVVAARSGACPEILDDPALGRLFEPDDVRSFVSALEEGLGLARDEEAVASRRRRAAEYDWPRVVTDYERLYAEVLDGRARPG